MSRTPEPMFLARETYRRRRMMDAGRMVPVLGAILFFAPALWVGQFTTFAGLIYLLLSWVLLIIVAGLLSKRLPQSGYEGGVERPPGETGGR